MNADRKTYQRLDMTGIGFWYFRMRCLIDEAFEAKPDLEF